MLRFINQPKKEKKKVKKTALILFISIALQCSKEETVELPITTSSEKALVFYQKALMEWESGGYVEKTAYFDSSIAIDSNFALALLYNDNPDNILKKKRRKRAHSLRETVTRQERLILDLEKNKNSGNLDAALVFSKKLVEENPTSYLAHNYLGTVRASRREFTESWAAFEKAINLNKDNYQANTWLWGLHFSESGPVELDTDKEKYIEIALQHIDELIRIRPTSGHPYHSKANLYRKLGDFEKAKPLYEKSIQKRKGSSAEGTALIVSGHNYMFSGDFETARNRYEKAVQASPKKEGKFGLNNYITLSYVFNEDYIGAIENINKLENNLKELGFLGGELLLRRAILNWQKFVFYAHNQVEKEANDALVLSIDLSRQRMAELKNDPVAERDQKSNIAYNKAWMHALFGRYGEARKNLDDVKNINEKINSPTAMHDYNNLMGMVSLMEGKAEGALQFFEKGNPDNTYFLYFKALALKALGDKDGAKEILTDIANTNFSYWELAIVRNRAKKLLENT